MPAVKGQKMPPRSRAHRAAIGAAARRNWRRPEYRKKMSAAISAALRGRKHSPETRAKISAANRGRKRTAEHQRNLSEALRRRAANPDVRRKMSAIQRELLKHGPQDPRPCEVCGGKQARGRSLDRDHDHVLGHQRGLLCGNCNVNLGNLENWLTGRNPDLGGVPRDEALLAKMFEYLRRTNSHSFTKREG